MQPRKRFSEAIIQRPEVLDHYVAEVAVLALEAAKGQRIDKAKLRKGPRRQVEEATLIDFNWQTFHKGNAATGPGWRWFVRISRLTGRKITNERRNQVQIYLPAPNAGW